MIMKRLFRKKILASIGSQTSFSQEHFAILQHALLQADEQTRLKFAQAVSSLVYDTAAKYRISPNSELRTLRRDANLAKIGRRY